MTKSKPKFNLALLISVLAVMLGIAVYYMTAPPSGKSGDKKPAISNHEDPNALPQELVMHDVPKALENLVFTNAQGKEQSLAAFQGQFLVVNFWATWCAPCREEMPSLSALQTHFADQPVKILAVSLDRGSPDKPLSFLQDLGVENLVFLHDPKSVTARQIGAFGLPTTLLVDAQGREIGRLLGEAEWDTQAIKDLITKRM
ncbi:MAG: TlpA family protein disulfide reductase [Parvibaculales bacterium]